MRSGTKCPRHLRKMTTQCALIDGHDTAKSSAPDGFVKPDNKFIINDNLEIFPSSKSLVLLQKLKVENMSFLDSLDIRVPTEEVLTVIKRISDIRQRAKQVFGEVLTKRDSYVLASLWEILSHTDNISSMSHELLRCLEPAQEIDLTYQARLARCVGDRELQISAALSGAFRDLDFTNCSELATSRLSTGRSQQNEELEKQVDKVVEKLCHLAICGSPSVEPALLNRDSRPKAPLFSHVMQSWSTSLTTHPPRCRKS